MKKIKYILLTVFVISAYSCSEDLLDQKPVNAVPIESGQNPIQDEASMKNTLIGMYTELAHPEAFSSHIPNFGNIASDDFFISAFNSGWFLTFHNMNWSASNSDTGFIYNKLYDVIAQANFVINSTITETDRVKSLKAQAYTARGLAYFYLAQGWGENPTSGTNQQYGVAMYTGEFDPLALYPRSTVEDNYKQIFSDLKAGIVPENEVVENKTFLSSTAARILLAKAYLTYGDYPNAILYANEAITEAPGAYYHLLDSSQIENYFYSNQSSLSEDQPETVFELANSALQNPGFNKTMGVLYDYLESGSNLNVRRSVLLRSNVYDSYGVNDTRRNLFVKDDREIDNPNPGYFINKYRNVIDGAAFSGNIKLLRLTEALFIKWEAMAKSGQGATALTEVNAFVTERGGTTYSGDALTAVLEEKRKEFVGEGQRFYDLKRNNLSIVKSTNCNSNCDVPSTDKLFVLPIPSYSLNINPNIEQYPGWGN